MHHILILLLFLMWKNNTALTTTPTLISPTPASVMTKLTSTSSTHSSNSVVFVTDKTTLEEPKSDAIRYEKTEIKSATATTLASTSAWSMAALASDYRIKSASVSTNISSFIDSSVKHTTEISPTATLSTASKEITPEFIYSLFTNTTPGATTLKASMISVDHSSDVTVAGIPWTTAEPTADTLVDYSAGKASSIEPTLAERTSTGQEPKSSAMLTSSGESAIYLTSKYTTKIKLTSIEPTTDSRTFITPTLATSTSGFSSLYISSSISPTNTAHETSTGFITDLLFSISIEGDIESTNNIIPVNSTEQTSNFTTGYRSQIASTPISTSSIALTTEYPYTSMSTYSSFVPTVHTFSTITPITLISSTDQVTSSKESYTTGMTPLLTSSAVLASVYSSTLFPNHTLPITPTLISITSTEQTTNSTTSYTTETTNTTPTYTTEITISTPTYTTETTISTPTYTTETTNSTPTYTTETTNTTPTYTTETTNTTPTYTTEITNTTQTYTAEITNTTPTYTTETTNSTPTYTTETTNTTPTYTTETTNSTPTYTTETTNTTPTYTAETTNTTPTYTTEITNTTPTYTTEITNTTPTYTTETTNTTPTYTTEITNTTPTYTTETTNTTPTYTTEITNTTPTYTTETTNTTPTYTTEITNTTPTYTTETTNSTPTYTTETTNSTPTYTTETTNTTPTYTTETTNSTPTYTTETTNSTPTYTTETTNTTPTYTTETTNTTPTYATEITNTTPTYTTEMASTTKPSYPTSTDIVTSPLPETTTQGCIINNSSGRISEDVPEEKSNLTVSCEFDAIGNCRNIQWRIRNYDTNENTTKITITHDRNGNRIQSKLVVHSLSQNDAGKIACHLGERSILLNITIQPLPVLSISPPSLVIAENGQVTMVCNISNVNCINRTDWNFSWYHNGSKVSTVGSHNVSASSLKFSSKRDSNGNYQCKLCRKSSPEKCQVSLNSSLQVYTKAFHYCEGSNDQGIYWDRTPAGYQLEKKCPEPTSGIATRQCHAEGIWGTAVMISCVRKEIEEASQKLEDIEGLSDKEKKNIIGEVLGSIKNVTADTGSEDGESISSGNLKATTEVLETMVNIISSNNSAIQVDNTTQENFVGIIDDMLSLKNEGSWAKIDYHTENSNSAPSASAAGSLLTKVEKFGSAVAKNLVAGGSVDLVKDNIVITIKHTDEPSIAFTPNGTAVGSGIHFNLNDNELENVTFTAALYKTMGNLLQKRSRSDFTSEVMALSINGKDTSHLSAPVILIFDTDFLMRQNNLTGKTIEKCVFWNDTQGWLTDGCSWVNDSCRCTHLTNFAVIISPVPASDAYVLRIISFVGCIISVLSTVTTMVVYMKLWRYLKSDRSRLLLNLCAALTIAYVLFLAGIDQTEDNTVCTIMAALLHYFFLATFCLMLAEGIQLLISVTFVFHAESKLRWLLLIGWGIPLVIVGVTIGITHDNGYHANDYCWLSLSNGVIYSFVGPAVCIIMVNVIVIFCVMKALFSSKFIATKTEKQKIVAGVRSVTVLLPVLGVTWLFGIISVNNDLIVFQYLFAVMNSLQGFFIFLFYCVFNVSVRRALEKKIKRFEFRTQSSKTGSKLQMVKTKSTDSGEMKDEERKLKEFHNPVFQFPRASIDTQHILTSRRFSPSSPSHDDDDFVENQYISRSHLYTQT